MSLDRRALFERGGKKTRMRWQELLFILDLLADTFLLNFKVSNSDEVYFYGEGGVSV